MARCSACSAPLPHHNGVCEYCGSHNDVDLKGIHEFTINKPESNRICPDCDIPLQTLDLQIDGKFYLERCTRCMGLFFDPGELEALMDKSVSNVYSIETKRLDALLREQSKTAEKITYRKCPVCRQLMHRTNFGHRSGVIVDQCKTDGLWLDSGELKRLLNWKKAGGQLLNESIMETREKEKQRKERLRAYQQTGSPGTFEGPFSSPPPNSEIDLIDTVAGILERFFR